MSSGPPRKRPKRAPSSGATSSSSSLGSARAKAANTPEHALGIDDLVGPPVDAVFSYLDARSLFRLVFCSKALVASVTHEHVIRSAVSSGGHARTSVEIVAGLVRAGRIFVPSPLRLLRLMNGSVCERGSSCVHEGGPKRANHVRREFGVFLCSECADFRESAATAKVNKVEHRALLENSRVVVIHDAFWGRRSVCRVWAAPFVDSSGERAGPVLSLSTFKRLEKEGKTVDGYLSEVDEADKFRPKADNIIGIHEAALEEFKKRSIAKAEAASVKRHSLLGKRVEKMKSWITVLCEALGDAPWKEFALSYERSGEGQKWSRRDPCVIFNCPITHDHLRQYAVVPNKATKAKIRDAAKKIQADFDLVWSPGFSFHDLSFLLDEPGTLEHDLYNYYHDRMGISPGDLILSKLMTAKVMELIRDGNLLEAFYRRFQTYAAWNQPDLDLQTFFVHSVLVSESLAGVPRSHAEKLVVEVFRAHYGHHFAYGVSFGFDKKWREVHGSNRERCAQMLAAAREYCDDVDAGCYGELPGDDERTRLDKKNVLKSGIGFTRRGTLACSPHLLLEKRDFVRLQQLVFHQSAIFVG